MTAASMTTDVRHSRGTLTRALKLTLAVLVLVITVVALAREIAERPVRSVRIVGEFHHLDRGRLERVLAAATGGSFFAVDVDQLRRASARSPWVRDVEVRRTWPDRLDLVVHERVAVARWNDASLLEGDGRAFTPGDVSDAGPVPRLVGPEGSQRRVLRRFERIQTALGKAGGGVARLELLPRGSWVAELRSGTRLLLGHDGDGIHGERALRFAVAALGESAFGKVERVDFRYANGFAVQPRRAAVDQQAEARR